MLALSLWDSAGLAAAFILGTAAGTVATIRIIEIVDWRWRHRERDRDT